MCTIQNTGKTKRNAFAANRRSALTLIETLVALVCLGILLPLLVAAAGSSSRPNREIMCAYRLGQLGSAMLQYTIDNEGYLPGSPGTSGAPVVLNNPASSDWGTPHTQTWDWAVPLACYLGVELMETRAERVAQFRVGKFWCPSNDIISEPYVGVSNFPPPEFRPIRMLSYNTMRDFLQFADDAPPAPIQHAQWSYNNPSNSGITIPSMYVPRIGNVGGTQGKVFMADGSRFTDSGGGVSHDVSSRPSGGGMYASSGPTLDNRYLRSYLFDLPEKAYSYRHTHGDTYGLNALHFDGHVAWLSEYTSRHPSRWFPSGTTLNVTSMNYDAFIQVFEEMSQHPQYLYVVP